MKKIAIIGANEFQNPLILKAKELGFETHVFAWADNAIGETTADVFYPISIKENAKIAEICRQIKVDAIASIGSDLAVHTVNYVSRAMGFPCNSERCERCATNKHLMRQAFELAGLPTPKNTIADGDFDPALLADFQYPLIVKPVDRSGSRGIMKIESSEQLLPAVSAACEQSFDGKAVIEEYIYGQEYSCESISFEGTHHMLAVTKKFTTDAPHFIETGHQEPSDISEDFLPKVREEVFRALDALDIRYGDSHAEFKITPAGDVRFIEVGARMGGDCIGSDLVYISTGMDYVKLVIDTACGLAPDLSIVKKPEKAEICFVFSQEDVRRYEKIYHEQPSRIWRATAMPESFSTTITDSSNRLGYYILRA